MDEVVDGAVAEIQRFSWIGQSTIQDAACLTFVRGSSMEHVAESFGAVREFARYLDIDEFCEEAFAHHERYPMIALRRIGSWVLVVEDNGNQGSRTEVLRRASVGTEAVSVFWNLASLTRFSHAAGGRTCTAFEALLPEYREGCDPDALEEFRRDLPWGQADPVPLMLALAARVTGEPLAPEHFGGDLLTFPVAAWPDDVRPISGGLECSGCPPTLVEAMRTTGSRGMRRAAVAVACHALAHADLLDHPMINRTLSALGTGNKIACRLISEAVRRWRWQLTVRRATSRARNQVRAAEVLRQATHDDPLTAVCAALEAARDVRGLDSAKLADIALGAARR